MSAPYRSADQALRFAYDREARDVCKVSSYLADLRGGSVRARLHFTPFELLAEAAMIIAAMRSTLPQSLRDVIELYYTVPSDVVLANRQERLARLISYALSLRFKNVDRWYLCDVVREWAGGKVARKMTDRQWALKLGVTPPTLTHWKIGRSGRKNSGVMKELDRMLNEGRGRMEAVYIEKGVVEVE